MSLNPNIEIGLNKLAGIWQKVSGVMSFKVLGYTAASGFVLATIVSVSSSAIMFSLQSTKKRSSQRMVSQNDLDQNVSLSDNEVKAVLKRNIFNKEGTLGGEPEPGEAKEEKIITNEIVKSNLPLKLWGTIYGGDPYSGIAMVEDTRKKTTNSFMVGDRLTENAVVKQILKEKIVFERSGQMEYIDLEKKELVRRKRGKKGKKSPISSLKKGRIKPSTGRLEKHSEDGFEFAENKIKMTAAYKKKLITTDFSKVLQDAKAEPNMVDGQLQGFKLTRIRSPSIYEKSGLANGDIVTEINGVELSSASQAIRTLQSLKTASQIEITVIQNGVKNTIEINVGQ